MGKVSVGNLGFLAVAARFLSDFVFVSIAVLLFYPPPFFSFFVCFVSLAAVFYAPSFCSFARLLDSSFLGFGLGNCG